MTRTSDLRFRNPGYATGRRVAVCSRLKLSVPYCISPRDLTQAECSFAFLSVALRSVTEQGCQSQFQSHLGQVRSRRHRDSSEPVRLSVGARRDTLDPLEGRVEALGVCEACFSRNGGDRERRVPKQATRRLHSTADDFLVNASAQGGPEPLFQRSTRAVRGRLGRGVQSGRGHGGYGLHRSRAWARVPRAPSCPSRRVATKIQH